MEKVKYITVYTANNADVATMPEYAWNQWVADNEFVEYSNGFVKTAPGKEFDGKPVKWDTNINGWVDNSDSYYSKVLKELNTAKKERDEFKTLTNQSDERIKQQDAKIEELSKMLTDFAQGGE